MLTRPISLTCAFAVACLAHIVFTYKSSEQYCNSKRLSYHPSPPIRAHVCVNTTSPCTNLEPGIKYCKRGSTGLWRLVRCEPGFELHVVKIKKPDELDGTDDFTSSPTVFEPNSTSAEANSSAFHSTTALYPLPRFSSHHGDIGENPSNEYYWGSCHDINECERGEEVHSCSHICYNVLGTFKCRCPIGFALARDGRTCLSIAKNLATLVGMFFSQSVDYISDHQL